ncbi:hypothetical protein HDU83_005590 [Entophlyctis luteolus]|nr:hypothetical protein HDU83_005590 [Entophlyctis luteolus]
MAAPGGSAKQSVFDKYKKKVEFLRRLFGKPANHNVAPAVTVAEDVKQANFYTTEDNPESLYSCMLRVQATDPISLCEFLHSDSITAHSITTPFGIRPVVYADYVASARPLLSIDKAMQTFVEPFYANTHNEAAVFGLAMTDLRESARLLIKKCCDADSNTSCLFLGSGSTAGFDRLVYLIGLRESVQVARESSDLLPVVFVSSAEHHSNILVWRESGANVVTIPTDGSTGLIRLDVLQQQLQLHANASMIVGSFTAASNVVGVLQPVYEIAKLIHAFKGLAFFDYAAAGPYVEISMCSEKRDAAEHLDAIFLSPHKFIGGPGTPGVLLVNNNCIKKDRPPAVPGGGSIVAVDGWGFHEYHSDVERREEAGTPDVLASIRAGFVFHIKSLLTADFITAKSFQLASYAFQKLSTNKKITILGPGSGTPRLPIFSFLVSTVAGEYLPHNFVNKILGDVFGIQVRSGTSCALPYFFELMEMSREKVDELKRIASSCSTFGGFTRFNLSVTHSKEEVDYLLDAIDWVASNGERLLSLYSRDPQRSRWICKLDEPSAVSNVFTSVRNAVKVPLDLEKFSEDALKALR